MSYEPISGYEDYFAINMNGEVWSYKRGNKRHAHTNPDGYKRITLYYKFDEGVKHFFIHKLVALTFLGPCPLNHEVNHKDGNKLNNHCSNLEYVTKGANRKHMYDICGRKPNKFRYTQEKINEILTLYQSLKSQQRVANTLNIPRSSVKSILDKNYY